PFWTRRVTVKEWKDSGGVSVPSVIRSVDGPARIGGEPQDYWFVSEWKSEDIGDRLPSDEDFAIKLDPEVRLQGMKTVPPDYIYDINQITDDDYSPPYRDSITDDGDVDARAWISGIGFGILGLALIVAAAVVLRRRKKKRQGGEEVKPSE
ncbi:MAG: LPXTG cell wall anchor domain-containing protein, partial [Thermoguttaceae bacterium]|nr:LPXTG cell wall anchor domain-containing protein [Thermoguttaceae bacterium]